MRAVRGSCVASSGASRAREGSRRWPAGGEVARARAGERRAHALVLLSEEGDDRKQRGWAGPPAGDGPSKWPMAFPSLVVLCFSISVILF